MQAAGYTESPLVRLLSGLAMGLLGAAVWIYAGSFPELDDGHPGPALFPRVIAIGLAAGGLGLLAGLVRQRWAGGWRGRDPVRLNRRGLLRWSGGLVLVALYPFATNLVGFIPALSVLMLAVALLLQARPLPALITAVVSAVVIYGLFTGLLGVPL